MTKFFAGVLYTVLTGAAAVVAYHHTLGDPFNAPVSGLIGFFLMVFGPQIGLAFTFWSSSFKE